MIDDFSPKWPSLDFFQNDGTNYEDEEDAKYFPLITWFDKLSCDDVSVNIIVLKQSSQSMVFTSKLICR